MKFIKLSYDGFYSRTAEFSFEEIKALADTEEKQAAHAALTFAKYGIKPDEAAVYDGTRVSLSFEQDGIPYEVTRGLNKDNKGVYEETAVLEIGTGYEVTTVTDVEDVNVIIGEVSKQDKIAVTVAGEVSSEIFEQLNALKSAKELSAQAKEEIAEYEAYAAKKADYDEVVALLDALTQDSEAFAEELKEAQDDLNEKSELSAILTEKSEKAETELKDYTDSLADVLARIEEKPEEYKALEVANAYFANADIEKVGNEEVLTDKDAAAQTLSNEIAALKLSLNETLASSTPEARKNILEALSAQDTVEIYSEAKGILNAVVSTTDVEIGALAERNTELVEAIKAKNAEAEELVKAARGEYETIDAAFADGVRSLQKLDCLYMKAALKEDEIAKTLEKAENLKASLPGYEKAVEDAAAASDAISEKIAELTAKLAEVSGKRNEILVNNKLVEHQRALTPGTVCKICEQQIQQAPEQLYIQEFKTTAFDAKLSDIQKNIDNAWLGLLKNQEDLGKKKAVVELSKTYINNLNKRVTDLDEVLLAIYNESGATDLASLRKIAATARETLISTITTYKAFVDNRNEAVELGAENDAVAAEIELLQTKVVAPASDKIKELDETLAKKAAELKETKKKGSAYEGKTAAEIFADFTDKDTVIAQSAVSISNLSEQYVKSQETIAALKTRNALIAERAVLGEFEGADIKYAPLVLKLTVKDIKDIEINKVEKAAEFEEIQAAKVDADAELEVATAKYNELNAVQAAKDEQKSAAEDALNGFRGFDEVIAQFADKELPDSRIVLSDESAEAVDAQIAFLEKTIKETPEVETQELRVADDDVTTVMTRLLA
ncbi:MAG: hypothetical protein LBN25_01305 [Christensenellaceae bacterium]|jgi:DNA repair exonuclease SbcCD ATPase subunit|nr:hypothetical protein [Christensenellaceae bacterium]